MRVLLSLILFSCGFVARASEVGFELRTCVIDQVLIQYPQMQDLRPQYAGSIVNDHENWDIILLTHFDDGGTGRLLISMTKGDYQNVQIYADGIQLPLNLSDCSDKD